MNRHMYIKGSAKLVHILYTVSVYMSKVAICNFPFKSVVSNRFWVGLRFGLQRIQHIGRGQYASAQLVEETATGRTFVAKCISLAALNEHDQDLAHQEARKKERS